MTQTSDLPPADGRTRGVHVELDLLVADAAQLLRAAETAMRAAGRGAALESLRADGLWTVDRAVAELTAFQGLSAGVELVDVTVEPLDFSDEHDGRKQTAGEQIDLLLAGLAPKLDADGRRRLAQELVDDDVFVDAVRAAARSIAGEDG